MSEDIMTFGKIFLVEKTNTPAWTAADKLRRAVDGEIVQLTGHEFEAVKQGKVVDMVINIYKEDKRDFLKEDK